MYIYIRTRKSCKEQDERKRLLFTKQEKRKGAGVLCWQPFCPLTAFKGNGAATSWRPSWKSGEGHGRRHKLHSQWVKSREVCGGSFVSKFRVKVQMWWCKDMYTDFILCFQPRLRKNCWKMLGETSVFVSPRSIFNRLQLQKDHCPLPSYQKCPSSKKPTDLLSCYRSRCFMDVSPFVGGVAQRPWDVFFWVVGSMAASFPLMDDWKNQNCDGNMVPEPETYCRVKGW